MSGAKRRGHHRGGQCRAGSGKQRRGHHRGGEQNQVTPGVDERPRQQLQDDHRREHDDGDAETHGDREGRKGIGVGRTVHELVATAAAADSRGSSVVVVGAGTGLGSDTGVEACVTPST